MPNAKITIADEFDFDRDDLEPKSKPVRYKSKSYVLREAGNSAVVAYRNATAKSTKMVDGKLSGFDGLAEAEPLLVSKCLFEAKDGQDHPVSIEFVKSMPNRFVKPMFDWLEEHSDINGALTAEDLKRQITSLQKRLEEIESGKPLPKDSAGTAGTSP